jgi:two-component system cell cycle sensor histidine kinase/response regulator CckA
LKNIDPEVKVLISSGYSMDNRAKDLLERGCCGFIQKPFRFETLTEKIAEIL